MCALSLSAYLGSVCQLAVDRLAQPTTPATFYWGDVRWAAILPPPPNAIETHPPACPPAGSGSRKTWPDAQDDPLVRLLFGVFAVLI